MHAVKILTLQHIVWVLPGLIYSKIVAMQYSCKNYLSDLEAGLGRRKMQKRKPLHWLQS